MVGSGSQEHFGCKDQNTGEGQRHQADKHLFLKNERQFQSWSGHANPVQAVDQPGGDDEHFTYRTKGLCARRKKLS